MSANVRHPSDPTLGDGTPLSVLPGQWATCVMVLVFVVCMATSAVAYDRTLDWRKVTPLEIEIVETTGAVSNIRSRVAREPIVEVEDVFPVPMATCRIGETAVQHVFDPQTQYDLIAVVVTQCARSPQQVVESIERKFTRSLLNSRREFPQSAQQRLSLPTYQRTWWPWRLIKALRLLRSRKEY